MLSRLFYSLIISLLPTILGAQDLKKTASAWQNRFLLGVDISKNIGGLLSKNYALFNIEPILRYAKNEQSLIYSLHIGYTQLDYPNADNLTSDYANQGVYLKLGVEKPLPRLQNRLTMGINFCMSNFSEKATIQISNDYFGAAYFPLQRKRAWNFGAELLMTFYQPLSKRMTLTAQMRLGSFFNPNWNFADSPNQDLAVKTFYVQGMGLSSGNLTSGYGLQLFYQLGK
jgi:hypothetical protein